MEVGNITSTGSGYNTLLRFFEAEKAYFSPEGGDFTVIADILDPEVVMHQPESLSYGGTWKGHQGFKAWMESFREQWSNLEVLSTEFYPNGDHVFSQSRVKATDRSIGKVVEFDLLSNL